MEPHGDATSAAPAPGCSQNHHCGGIGAQPGKPVVIEASQPAGKDAAPQECAVPRFFSSRLSLAAIKGGKEGSQREQGAPERHCGMAREQEKRSSKTRAPRALCPIGQTWLRAQSASLGPAHPCPLHIPVPAPTGQAPCAGTGSHTGDPCLSALPNNCGCPSDGYSEVTADGLCPAPKAPDDTPQPPRPRCSSPGLPCPQQTHQALRISPIAPLRQYPQNATVYINPMVIFVNTFKEQPIFR